MGVNADTGIAGLTLGGGFGKLGRKHGLSCDNLLAAEIVTADGRLVESQRHRERGPFLGHTRRRRQFRNIVTSFDFRLFPGLVLCFWPGSAPHAYSSAHEAMRFYHAICKHG